MATLGFDNSYHDPVVVDMSLLNEYLGSDDRDRGEGGQAAPDYGAGPASLPEAVAKDFATDTDTGTKKRGQGDSFVSPGDIQAQGLNQGNWGGAQGYAGNVNRQTADLFANLGRDAAANIPAITSGDQPMTALDVQRSGLHQDDFQAAQRYADSVNRQKGTTFAGLTPDQQRVMDTPPPKPALPDMAGTPAGGPQAMAAGEGWYVDNRGQFHSQNDGANIIANRPNAGEGYSIGRGTILDIGAPRGPVGAPNTISAGLGPGLANAGDWLDAGHRLPANLGLGGGYPALGDMGNLPAPPGAATGGAGGATTPYANYNPRLDTTVAQTYGGGAGGTGAGQAGAAGGAPGLPPGFTRQGNTRVVTGPDGTMYVTDQNGFLNPDAQRARDWQSRASLDVNATTQFAPDAIEKLRYLDSLGISTPEEKRFLQTIGTGDQFASTQVYADYVNRHNAQARSLGMDTKQLDAPARIIPMDQAFPILKEYGDLLRQLGATNVSIRPDNHTIYEVGKDTPIMQWRSANNNNYALSGDTPLANVLDDLAKLRQIAASQQQAAAAAAAGGGGGRGGGGGYGGGGRGGGGGGGGGTGVQGSGTQVPGGFGDIMTAGARQRLEEMFPGMTAADWANAPASVRAAASGAAYAPTIMGPNGVSPYDEITSMPPNPQAPYSPFRYQGGTVPDMDMGANGPIVPGAADQWTQAGMSPFLRDVDNALAPAYGAFGIRNPQDLANMPDPTFPMPAAGTPAANLGGAIGDAASALGTTAQRARRYFGG